MATIPGNLPVFNYNTSDVGPLWSGVFLDLSSVISALEKYMVASIVNHPGDPNHVGITIGISGDAKFYCDVLIHDKSTFAHLFAMYMDYIMANGLVTNVGDLVLREETLPAGKLGAVGDYGRQSFSLGLILFSHMELIADREAA